MILYTYYLKQKIPKKLIINMFLQDGKNNYKNSYNN